MQKTADVFLCHSHKDHETAAAVCAALESRGAACWIAPRDVAPGTGYAAKIIDAIETSRVLVLLLSRSANRSRHVVREVERAVSKNVPILPVILQRSRRNRSLEFLLATTQELNGVDMPIGRLTERLAKCLTRHHGIELQPGGADEGPPPAADTRLTALSRQIVELRCAIRSATGRLARWLGEIQEYGKSHRRQVVQAAVLSLLVSLGLVAATGAGQAPTEPVAQPAATVDPADDPDSRDPSAQWQNLFDDFRSPTEAAAGTEKPDPEPAPAQPADSKATTETPKPVSPAPADEVLIDSRTWTRQGNGEEVEHSAAEAYCKALSGGWRLPTKDELKGLRRAQKKSCLLADCSVGLWPLEGDEIIDMGAGPWKQLLPRFKEKVRAQVICVRDG